MTRLLMLALVATVLAGCQAYNLSSSAKLHEPMHLGDRTTFNFDPDCPTDGTTRLVRQQIKRNLESRGYRFVGDGRVASYTVAFGWNWKRHNHSRNYQYDRKIGRVGDLDVYRTETGTRTSHRWTQKIVINVFERKLDGGLLGDQPRYEKVWTGEAVNANASKGADTEAAFTVLVAEALKHLGQGEAPPAAGHYSSWDVTATPLTRAHHPPRPN